MGWADRLMGAAVQGPPLGAVGLGWEHRPGPRGHLPVLADYLSQIWPYLSMIMENKFREKLGPRSGEERAGTFAFTKLCWTEGWCCLGRAAGSPPPRGSHLTHRVPSPTCTSQSLS